MKHFIQSISLRTLVTLAVAVGFTALFSGCGTVPVTGRSQLNLMSPSEEMQLGLTSFEETKKQVPISKDTAANAMVQRVGKRMEGQHRRHQAQHHEHGDVGQQEQSDAFHGVSVEQVAAEAAPTGLKPIVGLLTAFSRG